MSKRIISLLMSFLILINGIMSYPVLADDYGPDENAVILEETDITTADVENAISIINSAIDEMPELFTPEQTSTFTQLFNGFVNVGSAALSVIGIVNTAVTFLRITGLMSGGTEQGLAHISHQLEEIAVQLNEMDGKLNNISHEMDKIKASMEFTARAQKTTAMLSNWNDFSYRYMENGMDRLMTRYNSKMMSGWMEWCYNESDSARYWGRIDNTRVALLYNDNENGPGLIFSSGNFVKTDNGYVLMSPDDDGQTTAVPEYDRYLILPPEVLPDSLDWDVNTYQDDLESYITEQILLSVESEDYSGFANFGFPEFTAEYADMMTEELARKVAKDAVDVLAYRISCAEVNQDTEFSGEVIDAFQNYCSHLKKPEDGIDSIMKSYYLTHSFEYEIKDDLMDLCNGMILKTGVYGTFVSQVMGMSKSVTDDQKEDVISSYCDALTNLDDVKKGCLTGEDEYCYLTNSKLVLTDLAVQYQATIFADADGSQDIYKGYQVDGPKLSFGLKGYGPQDLIGDSKALLLIYTLQSNGKTLNDDLVKEVFAHYPPEQYVVFGPYITSIDTDVNIPLELPYPMNCIRTIGGWFPENAVVGMNYRPEDATSDYYVYHRMVKGSYINNKSGVLQTDLMLNGLAIYGERHAYWWDDESAFLFGPINEDQMKGYQKVCTKDYGLRKYEHRLTWWTFFYTLVKQAVSFGGDTDGPIASFEEMSESLSADSIRDAHTWDEGVVTKEPTCTEKGIKTVTALDDDSLHYEEDIEPLGHKWDEGIETRIPSASLKGIKTFTCENDPSHTYTECIDVTTEASVALDREKVSVDIGSSVKLNTVFDPDRIPKSVEWTSSDPKIAKVDEDGSITGIKAGKTKITVHVPGTDASAECDVTVLFKDVKETHGYADAIYWAVGEGITSGYTGADAGKFGPSDPVTRGQVVMFLWRLAGQPEPVSGRQVFTDVPSTHSYFKAIQWANEQGIARGYTGKNAGKFGPADKCTRGQIAMFIWRYYGQQEPKEGAKSFSDVPETNNFRKAVMWASGEGITAGYKDGTFGVNKNCTRGQMVMFLWRAEGKQ